MSILCCLFGHRILTDKNIVFDFGGATYNIGVCVRCNSITGKPKNDRAKVIALEEEVPLYMKG
jgi:hypothetical protein